MQKVSSYYLDMLNNVRSQIFDSIRDLMGKLGGKVCFRMYHDYDLIDSRHTFFEVDGDGYGRELFIDTVVLKPNSKDITIALHDTEDCYEPFWELEDLNPADALYMLQELEEIVEFHEGEEKPVLTEYDEDFDWENY